MKYLIFSLRVCRSNHLLSIKTIRLILLFHPAQSTPYLLKYLALHCTQVFPLPYLPACLSPRARRAFPPAFLRLSTRSQRLPSVTPSDSLFSGTICLCLPYFRDTFRGTKTHRSTQRSAVRSLLSYHRIY